MNKTKLIATFSLLSLLVSCAPTDPDTLNHKFISPAGAPSLALYTLYEDSEHYVTNSTPTLVRDELVADEYNYVIFDSISGLRFIKQNNANFKLYSLITGGNFFLAGINKNENSIPSADDYIVSFGEGLIPDLAYDYLYPNAPVDAYVNATSDAAAVLMNGTYQGNEVDYVFIAEPSLYGAMNNQTATTYGQVNIISNIKKEFEEKTGLPGIPQAGLFVRYEGFYDTYADEIDEYLKFIDTNIVTATEHPEDVVTYLNQFDQTLVRARFGYNAAQVNALQSGGKNSFGLVKPDERADLGINQFLTLLNQPLVDETLIL